MSGGAVVRGDGRLHREGAAVVGAFVLLAAALVGLGPLSTPAAAAPADGPCVQLVVSYGDLGGGDDADCVPVTAGTDGLEVLRDAGHALEFDDSGLLCSIDGKPAGGCGERSGAGYAYWSYWTRDGDDPWRYATRGPGAREMPLDGQHAEGWAWNPGVCQTCAQPADIPFTTTCPPATATAPDTSGTGSTGGGGTGGATSGTGSTGSAGGSTGGTSNGAAAAGSGATATPPGTAGTAATASPTATTTASPSAAAAGGNVSTDALDRPREPAASGDAETDEGAVLSSSDDPVDSTSPLLTIAGVAVAAALAATATVVARRRRMPQD